MSVCASQSLPDESRPQSSRPVLQAGAVVGLAIMGDSLMYTLLPLEASRLGLTPTAVGVLLSINRLVRLFSNVLVGALFARWGPRLPFVLAVLLGLGTTFLYSVPVGVGVFLLARIGWGIAWSALRQGGYQTVWAVSPRRRARMMGIFWGLVRLGSALSVLVGGYVRDRVGYTAAVTLIAAIGLVAVPLAWWFPWPRAAGRVRLNGFTPIVLWHGLRAPRVRWVLAAGLLQAVLEATLVATAALFLAAHVPSQARDYLGTATGVLVAVRWLADVVMGPLFGAVADRVGTHRLCLTLVGLIVLWLMGGLLLRGWWSVLLLAFVLVANAGLLVSLAAAANTEALHTPTPHLVVAAYTTAIDVGLAAGPLVGYLLGIRLPLSLLYLSIAVTLGMVLLGYSRVSRSPVR